VFIAGHFGCPPPIRSAIRSIPAVKTAKKYFSIKFIKSGEVNYE
jgi:hypothetical protein